MMSDAGLESLRSLPRTVWRTTERRTPWGRQFGRMKTTKMMWACLAFVAVVVAVAVGSANGGYALLAVGCAVMMGAMAWMMMGGPRGGSGRSSDG